MQNKVYTIGEYLLRIIIGINGYWFIPGLIFFYLLSPWFIKMAKRNWKMLLILSFVFEIIPFLGVQLWYIIIGKPEAIASTITAVYYNFFCWTFFFPFGVVCGLYIDRFKALLIHHRKTILFITFVSFIINVILVFNQQGNIDLTKYWYLNFNVYLHQLFSLSLVLTFLAFSEKSFPFSTLIYKLNSWTLAI